MLKLQYKAWLSACALLLLPLAAHAAGLGQIKILSALGQPLRAEIDLSATEEELSSLSVKLASPDAFRKANIEYSSALMGVRFSVEQRAGGTPYVKVTSTRAINDTFIDLLVELDWAQGQLLREYTALIDPPDYTPPVPSAVTSASVPQSVVEQPTTQTSEATSSQVTTTPLSQTAPPVAPTETTGSEEAASSTTVATAGATSVTEVPSTETATASEPAQTTTEATTDATTSAASNESQEYKVKAGDTLVKIANATKPDGVTVEQMLVALFQANPDAFSGKNMNRLKAGKILREPAYDEITAIAPDDATKEIRVQAANWNTYRQKIAEAAAVTPAQESQSATGGKIAAVEQAPTAQGASKEIVKLSKGESGTPEARARALQEEVTAKQKALDDANMRIAALEKNVKDMQHLLELKGVASPTAAPAVAAPKPQQPATPAPVAAPSAPAAVQQPVPAPATVAAQPPAAPPAAPKKPKVVAPPPPPPSLLDTILGNPLYLAALAIVVLGGGGYWWWRRGATGGAAPKKKVSKSRVEDAGENDGDDDLKLMHKTVTMPAVAAASAPASAAASNSDVDPIAEAELYLNFGRDAQAEEVLKEALRVNPQHEAAQIKLLQIYANRKDKDAFEKAARIYHEQAGARTNWLSVVAMGYALDPSNALYADGANVDASALALGSASQDHGAMDLDFDLLSSEASSAANMLDIGGSSDAIADMEKTSFIRPGDLNQGVMDITGDLGHGAPAIPDFSVPELDEDGLAKTDIALGGLDAGHGIDFSTDAAPPPVAAPSETHDRGPLIPDFKIDFNELSNDLGGAAAVASSASSDMSLSDISLSLDMPSGSLATGDSATSDVKDAHWFDVQTKFDLAKAYQEMGDSDGAREILQEVVRDGDNTQRTEAQKLLDSIS